MISILMKLIGAAGLLIVSAGILKHTNREQNKKFILGGVCLLAYSIYLKDPVFIPLQIVFISASVYKIYTLSKKK